MPRGTGDRSAPRSKPSRPFRIQRPWKLTMNVKVVEPREKRERERPEPKPPMTDAAHSRPDILDVHSGPDAPPITVEKVPATAYYCREGPCYRALAASSQH